MVAHLVHAISNNLPVLENNGALFRSDFMNGLGIRAEWYQLMSNPTLIPEQIKKDANLCPSTANAYPKFGIDDKFNLASFLESQKINMSNNKEL